MMCLTNLVVKQIAQSKLRNWNSLRLKELFSNLTYQKNHHITCYQTFIKKQLFKNFQSFTSSQDKWITNASKLSYLHSHNNKFERNLYPFKCKHNFYKDSYHIRLYNTKEETRKKVQKRINEIKENIVTIPNGLCALRILSTPFLGYLVLSEFYTISLGLFVCAGFTDLIDGYIARNFPNQQSMIGSFLDPAADKLLIATLVITLTCNGLIPVPLTSLIIFRDACLMGAGFYIRYVSLPPPKTLVRYFDMSFATAKLSPTTVSKANTFLQLCLVAASLAAPVFNYIDHQYLHILWYVTGTTTVISAGSYLYYNHSTYKFLTRSKKEEK